MNYPLTQFSKASGCGCKIAPSELTKILSHCGTSQVDLNLLIGNSNNDDAAAYALNETDALLSTTDFFMPMVDNAYDFGCIAAANALSDIYAMGGKPIMALAILGWPLEKLPAEVAGEVMRGAKETCASVSIQIAGGHSVESPEPFFGLSVNGIAPIKNLKQNNGAKVGDLVAITKPLGLGIASTAGKRGLLSEEEKAEFIQHMKHVNSIGAEFAKVEGVHAMTDITGFGLAGHLIEMCEASGCSAKIDYQNIPVLESAKRAVAQFVFPDITTKNFQNIQPKSSALSGEQLLVLCDPQTSGGLLVAFQPDALEELKKLCALQNESFTVIGSLQGPKEIYLEVM
jgi:selenide,water dikinase